MRVSVNPSTAHGNMEAGTCQFSRCGDQVAVCGADGEVKIWERSTGTLKQRFKPGQGPLSCLSWSRLAKVSFLARLS